MDSKLDEHHHKMLAAFKQSLMPHMTKERNEMLEKEEENAEKAVNQS